MKATVTEHVDTLFDKRMYCVYGVLFTIASFSAALYHAVLEKSPPGYQAYIFLGVGVVALIVTLLMTRK